MPDGVSTSRALWNSPAGVAIVRCPWYQCPNWSWGSRANLTKLPMATPYCGSGTASLLASELAPSELVGGGLLGGGERGRRELRHPGGDEQLEVVGGGLAEVEVG